MLLLLLMITINHAYVRAEASESSTPIRFIVWLELPKLIMLTPINVTTIASHTCHDGTTLRNTMVSATNTGKRKQSVVASPEGIYLKASNKNILLSVNMAPKANKTPICLGVTLKLCLSRSSRIPNKPTAMA